MSIQLFDSTLASALTEVQKLTNGSQGLSIEAVGPRRDVYLNILPLLFDIDVSYKGHNQLLKPSNCNNVSAVLQDEEGFVPSCKPKYQIVRTESGYEVLDFIDLDIRTPLNALKRADIRIW